MCTSPLWDLFRQVQAQGQEEVSEKGRRAWHALQGQPRDHTTGGPGVPAARVFHLGDSSKCELRVKVAHAPLPRRPSGASEGPRGRACFSAEGERATVNSAPITERVCLFPVSPKEARPKGTESQVGSKSTVHLDDRQPEPLTRSPKQTLGSSLSPTPDFTLG